MVLGTRTLAHWELGPSGFGLFSLAWDSVPFLILTRYACFPISQARVRRSGKGTAEVIASVRRPRRAFVTTYLAGLVRVFKGLIVLLGKSMQCLGT